MALPGFPWVADLLSFQMLDTHLSLFEIAALEETVLPRLALRAAEEKDQWFFRVFRG